MRIENETQNWGWLSTANVFLKKERRQSFHSLFPFDLSLEIRHRVWDRRFMARRFLVIIDSYNGEGDGVGQHGKCGAFVDRKAKRK